MFGLVALQNSPPLRKASATLRKGEAADVIALFRLTQAVLIGASPL
jgi:hypothetical protein